MSDFGKLLGPMARRIGNLLARGSVAAVNGTGKMRTLQLRMLAGEVKDNVEHFEPYGFTSEVLRRGTSPHFLMEIDRMVWCWLPLTVATACNSSPAKWPSSPITATRW